MRKLLFALGALLLGASSAFSQATTSLNATVPGSGTPFSFDSAVGSTPPYWPLVRLWDGTTRMTVVPLGQALPGASIPTVPPLVTYSQDPCYLQKKTPFTVTSSNTASTQLIGLVALNTIYICSIAVKPAAATVFNLTEGVGTNCGGGSPAPQAVLGSLTTANGMPFSGIGDGFAWGNGLGSVLSIHTSGDALCFTQTVAEAISITIMYVQTQL